MLYLDYILYIIIIFLLCILIKKNFDNKEGFEHNGKGVVVQPKKKYQSVIESAQYGGFQEWSGSKFKDVVDVKPFLDKLINEGADSLVVSHNTLGLNSDPAPKTDNYLLIRFTDPTIKVTDARGQNPDWSSKGPIGAVFSLTWAWNEGDSVSLKFVSGTEPFLLTATKSLYKIADLFAYIIIRAPYQFIKQMVNLAIKFVKNFQEIFKPILDFIKQMKNIAKDIFHQMYKIWKNLFDQWLAIVKDIPKFLRDMFNTFVDFMQTAVTKTFEIFKKFYDVFLTVFNTLIQLPITIFDIISQLTTVFTNLFLTIVKIPTTALNMTISLQNTLLDVMDKEPQIPFLNSFFA
jgi:phage-related protein